MTSWRESTSPAAQDDLDGLLGAVLPFAEESLAKYGEFFPYGAAVDLDGQMAMLATDPGLGEQPPSNEVLNGLYTAARSTAEARRAAAFVADVRVEGGDAIRIEVEHREGTALTILVPYSRSRFTKKVTLGQMSVARGDPRVWSA